MVLIFAPESNSSVNLSTNSLKSSFNIFSTSMNTVSSLVTGLSSSSKISFLRLSVSKANLSLVLKTALYLSIYSKSLLSVIFKLLINIFIASSIIKSNLIGLIPDSFFSKISYCIEDINNSCVLPSESTEKKQAFKTNSNIFVNVFV